MEMAQGIGFLPSPSPPMLETWTEFPAPYIDFPKLVWTFEKGTFGWEVCIFFYLCL